MWSSVRLPALLTFGGSTIKHSLKVKELILEHWPGKYRPCWLWHRKVSDLFSLYSLVFCFSSPKRKKRLTWNSAQPARLNRLSGGRATPECEATETNKQTNKKTNPHSDNPQTNRHGMKDYGYTLQVFPVFDTWFISHMNTSQSWLCAVKCCYKKKLSFWKKIYYIMTCVMICFKASGVILYS